MPYPPLEWSSLQSIDGAMTDPLMLFLQAV